MDREGEKTKDDTESKNELYSNKNLLYLCLPR